MKGSSHKHDLSFLIGRDLDCICIEHGQLQLLFHAPVSNLRGVGIAVQSRVIHQGKSGTMEWDCNKPVTAFCSLLMLLRAPLARVTGLPDGTLKLQFANDESVTILTSARNEHSYQVWDGDAVTVF